MPKLNFKAVAVEDVARVSEQLLDDLQGLLQVPRANLSIEVTPSSYVRDGVVEEAMPVVEVEWLARNRELQDQACEIVARHLKAMGHDSADIIFTILDPDRFYRIRP